MSIFSLRKDINYHQRQNGVLEIKGRLGLLENFNDYFLENYLNKYDHSKQIKKGIAQNVSHTYNTSELTSMRHE